MAEGTYVQNTEIQFVDFPLKDWNCPVCLELLKDPFLTECCGHHFCDRCINNVKQQQNVCPMCKAYPIKGIIDKRFKREISEAQVYCPLQPQGCEWTGEYGNLSTHLSVGKQDGQCKHVVVSCPNNNCNMKFRRHDIKRHANKECNYRPFMCPHCSYKDVFLFIEQHHFPECPNYPVVCPNKCNRNIIKRSQLQKHFGTCPYAMVPCPFSEVGCKAKMKRCNLKKHNDSHFIQHQSLICIAIVDLQKDNTTIKKDFNLDSEELFAELESTQARISSLDRKCSELEDNFYSSTAEIDSQNKKLTAELNQTKKYLQHLFTKYSEAQDTMSIVCKENKQLKHSLDAVKIEVAELKSQLATANQVSAVRESKMKATLTAFMAETKTMLQDEVTKKTAPLQRDVSIISRQNLRAEYWIDGYKLMAEKMKKANWALYLKTMAETATQFPDPTSPVILQLNGYEEAKRKRNSLITSSFYISVPRGKYKFVLVVSFSRDNMVVSASIVRGKRDSSLSWPFNGTIIVTLLNQLEDKNHYNREIWSATDKPGLTYAGMVPPSKFRNPSWCRQHFIGFAELEGSSDPSFLVNNTLYFEVNISPRKDDGEYYCCLS